ncbi:mitochondrial ribosomal protein L41 [Nomia melanderi]|uniref:mitochondrial ribosomal protein L41 n=1 Tax=Nomia melanderi TaxID=2448451 RepID=UPI0013045B56|nr:39S ribosomal protein L41, mitochondrial [Nomia melanderi]XP_031830418.1 39S ribosomal protein L41, mitochondrial [Nomia melanderi]XP_031830419.1 39S ribosomal protein L41, mitochondrial [Nomia melanderi]XP_031830420.1 39S ribosomal protein L41, mitochondrial [Nomia melanderi]
MASTCMIIRRQISTSSVCYGKRNFRKFLLYNKRGSRAFKEAQKKNPDPHIPIDKRGVRDTGIKVGDKFVNIPEMIPELIVPSLKDFPLKPYVSYQTEDVIRKEFTAKDLFNLVYAEKIKKDFETNQLGPNGEPLNPNEYEKLTPEDAKMLADQTGTDIFTEYKYCPKW